MAKVGVDCKFAPDGSVQVRRIQIGGSWKSVDQGRQWLDQHGRHVLIMLPGNQVREIVLRAETMTWELMRGQGDMHVV